MEFSIVVLVVCHRLAGLGFSTLAGATRPGGMRLRGQLKACYWLEMLRLELCATAKLTCCGALHSVVEWGGVLHSTAEQSAPPRSTSEQGGVEHTTPQLRLDIARR